MDGEKPLFIPLKREYFEAFKAGLKDTEYRKAGGRWNHDTCYPGRPVVLSLGYGKKHRLKGTVTVFFESLLMGEAADAFKACYGDKEAFAACIGIRLNN